MNLPRYTLSSDIHQETFEFISEGVKGKIHKLIQFTPTNLKNIYNLAFGDKDLKTGKIDDLVVSNNGDSEKVLATVVSAIYVFSDKNKDTMIYVTGSTESRTRLYRIGINKYLEEVNSDFDIFGELKDSWELFQKDKDYVGYLLVRKIN